MNERIKKNRYYLNIAREVSKRSTCLRSCYGAVIVNNDEIVSTGYNGAPRGRRNCNEIGSCLRNELNISKGERYELCRSVHAEANAIISASRERMIGATLYLSGYQPDTGEIIENMDCCSMCKRLVINAGITKVVFDSPDESFNLIDVHSWVMLDDTTISKKEMIHKIKLKYGDTDSIDDTDVKLLCELFDFDIIDNNIDWNWVVDAMYSDKRVDNINKFYNSIAGVM